MGKTGILVTFSAAIALGSAGAFAAPREVQFRSVDLAEGVIELHNFGAVNEAMDGWQFCSHSDLGARRYTLPNGLNGVTLDAGASLFVHTANDAPTGDPQRVNLSSIGGNWALPMDTGPYSIALFYPNGGSVSFGSTADMVDHLQWAIGGSSADFSASFRNAQAVSAGLWDDASAWVNTAADSELITLNDTAGGILHGASDYTVSIAALLGDLNTDGFVGIEDLNLVLSNWNQTVSPPGDLLQGDAFDDPLNPGFIGIEDLNVVLGNWNAGTPPPPGEAVPEPASLALLGLTASAALRRRR